jgi:putative ABC transport system permease protein
MNAWKFLIRSLSFYAKSHVGTFLGAVIASSILIGALVVGDSVRGSLLDMAMARLGRIDTVITGNDRLFREALADALEAEPFADITPALQLPAVGSASGGEARANQSQLIGVRPEFWSMGLKPTPDAHPGKEEVTLSRALASQLKVEPGDNIILRVQKPSLISPDAPLAPEEDTSLALTLTVAHIVEDASMGRFSLHASQLPPWNAFVDLEFLQTELETPGKANLLLLAQSGDTPTAPTDGTAALETLREHWTLEDTQLNWVDLNATGGNGYELRSERVFMNDVSVNSALQASEKGKGLLTYFVNGIKKGDRETPFSMVTAAESGFLPTDMKDDEIVITQWLADDLDAKQGDSIDLSYFVVGLGRALEETSVRFTVRDIVPLEQPYADPTFMPDFPGLKDADNCRDWDTGFPIDLDKIRSKDNDFWEEHKGTPKAFITLARGKEIWKNRFGSLTAVRYSGVTTEEERNLITQQIQKRLDPAKIGIMSIPVKQQAWASVSQSQDFGGLFIGFSFFLITAALILMNLLFQFVIEQRTREAGILMALGMTPKRLKQFLLREGVLLSLLGTIVGAILAVLYAKGMLYGLSTIWRDAVGTSSLTFHFNTPTVAGGFVGSIAVAGLTLWFGLRKQLQKPAQVLLTESQVEGQTLDKGNSGSSKWFLIGSACGLGAIGAAALGAMGDPSKAAGAFFGAGALMLVSGLLLASAYLRKLQTASGDHSPSLVQWGLRNASRRRKRSLATVSMLACGSFLIIAVGANKLDALRDADQRASGTGGFAFWGESSKPIIKDLNTEDGAFSYNLFPEDLEGVRFVSFRQRAGEEASCLNLNRAQRPRILGVNPQELASRKAFTFAQTWAKVPEDGSAWDLLSKNEPDGTIPGIADFNSIMWAMGKSVGDILIFQNTNGETFKVRLVAGIANSILQGNVIIAETAFTTQFPNEAGYKVFLVDAPTEKKEDVSKNLSRAMEDEGLTLTDTIDRMSAFNAVQNTYLSTFQLLGGLGMILGSFGLGAVVLRNLLDRRAELGLLAAVGFTKNRIRLLVLVEHVGLLMAGLLIGTISALMAVYPSLQSPGADIPYASLAATLGVICTTGFVWTWLAAQSALNGRFLDALRNQ